MHTKPEKKVLTEEKLQEVVRRIVAAVHPEKIILFGSAARGDMSPDSDLDLLVIKAGEHRRRTAGEIERCLIGTGLPTDVIVATRKVCFVAKRPAGGLYQSRGVGKGLSATGRPSRLAATWAFTSGKGN